jgi:hypothetical protein
MKIHLHKYLLLQKRKKPDFIACDLHLVNGRKWDTISSMCPILKFLCCTWKLTFFYVQSYILCEQFRNDLPVASVCRQLCSKAAYKPVWHISLLSVQWITSDDGQRNCPKHVVSFQNKFEKLVHILGFITRKFVTMHGHMSRCTITWM